MAFKVGDVVMLKSGGPEMTVSEVIATSGKFRTQWFGGRKLENGVFPPESLVHPPTDSKAPKK